MRSDAKAGKIVHSGASSRPECDKYSLGEGLSGLKKAPRGKSHSKSSSTRDHSPPLPFHEHRKPSLHSPNERLSVPKILTLFIPEILSHPAVAERAKTLPVPPVGRPVGRREEDVGNVKAARSRDLAQSRSRIRGNSFPTRALRWRRIVRPW